MRYRILISAAEVSSDHHGASWVKALVEAFPEHEFEFFGIGGDHLASCGVDIVFHSKELREMGSTEALGKVPTLWRVSRKLKKEAKERQPHLAIVMDYPEFHMRMGRSFWKLGIPTIYYIPPKVWVWRQHRIHALKRGLAALEQSASGVQVNRGSRWVRLHIRGQGRRATPSRSASRRGTTWSGSPSDDPSATRRRCWPTP